jgi:hypothetical protein
VRSLPGIALVATTLLASACGSAPAPAPEAATEEQPAPGPRKKLVDDCAVVPGQPEPKPLARTYEGVAAKARCDREVYTIMGGLTHFLGVKCEYCHVKDQFEKPTHRKSIANWMARELIPSLEKKSGGEVWCNDCHVVSGKGKAKILGNPRKQSWAVEWMTAHLTDDFQRSADHGSLNFKRTIILTDLLPPRPAPAPAEPTTTPADLPDAGAPDAEPPGADAGADAAP